MIQNVVILGSTGFVGESTLSVLRLHANRFRVFALGGSQRVEELLAQCEEFRPRYAVLQDAKSAAQLSAAVSQRRLPTEVLQGDGALERVASHPAGALVVMAIAGAQGLDATFAAAAAGKRILLASKEVLVVAGRLLRETARRGGAQLLPLDSEHNAVLQCLPREGGTGSVRRVWLTASGGPFRKFPRARLHGVTPEQACEHPTWKMGRKISVDSATMMNKGLELIEACALFELQSRQVEVVVHPQSIVHSLVEYEDGSVLAQLSNPDMRIPIAHGLGFPQRIASGALPLDLVRTGTLEFCAPDEGRFPCLRLAREALEAGACAVIYLNAANTVAVEEFLAGRLGFLQIPELVAQVLQSRPEEEQVDSLATLRRIDENARSLAGSCRDALGEQLRTGSGL